jgi:Tfp pilus assembly protein PilV
MDTKRTSRSGLSIFEVVIAVAIFAVITAGFAGAYALSLKSRRVAGDRIHAVFLAEEGLEAAQNIRDSNFSSMVNGTWGLATTSNKWTLSGSQDVNAGFTRQIVITSADSSTKQIVANVSWREPGAVATSTVSLSTYLTNLLYSTQASCLTVSTSSASISGFNLVGITLKNPCGILDTIDRITVSWTNAPSALVTQVQINGSTVWSGSDTRGSTLDITNVAVPAGTTAMPINQFVFNSNLTGQTFTLTIVMTDQSSQIVTLTPP